jgi:hypothetical protein
VGIVRLGAERGRGPVARTIVQTLDDALALREIGTTRPRTPTRHRESPERGSSRAP